MRAVGQRALGRADNATPRSPRKGGAPPTTTTPNAAARACGAAATPRRARAARRPTAAPRGRPNHADVVFLTTKTELAAKLPEGHRVVKDLAPIHRALVEFHPSSDKYLPAVTEAAKKAAA